MKTAKSESLPAGLQARKELGTTLIELLVVIVVFLIGILAVVQIFPKGFQLLVVTRNNSVAAKLAEDEIERLNQHADELPEQILSVHYIGGVPVQDTLRDPYDLGPQGDAVDQTGLLSLQGTNIGNWLLYSGPNSFRRIVAEGGRVPSPRPVGNNYGGLKVLTFGPIDCKFAADGFTPINLNAYANDYTKDLTLPDNLTQVATPQTNVTIGTNNAVSCPLYDSSATLSSTEYFVANPTTNAPILFLPTSGQFSRTYHIRLSVLVQDSAHPSGGTRDYPDLLITIPPTTQLDANNSTPQLIQVPVQAILSNLALLAPTDTFLSINFDSLQIAPEFNLIQNSSTFSADPLQYKLLDPTIGVLLFNPVAYSEFLERPGQPREPLQARVSYDVYDWRILKQEFRVDNQQGLNGGNYGQFQLDLQSVKVGSSAGPDGLPNGNILPLENVAPYMTTQYSGDDNLVLVDLLTGGVIYEVDPNNPNEQVVTVNKSTGVVTVHEDGTGAGLLANLLIPGTTDPVQVDLTGRSIRALYRAKNEFSVNVLKSASSFAFTDSPTPSEGQVYNPPGSSILVFPKSDLHQQITVDTIDFKDSSGGSQTMNGQSFQVETPTTGGSPQVDVGTALPSGSTIVSVAGASSIRGVKGASMIVQVLWNPAQFNFHTTIADNIGLIDKWEQNWRKNTTQTTIQTQEIQ